MNANKDKFYCQVTTRNYPVNITPIISRYTMITKYLTIYQIAMCINSHADVKLIKGSSKITLTQGNYKSTLKEYLNEQKYIEAMEIKSEKEKKNKESSEKIKARPSDTAPIKEIKENKKEEKIEELQELVDNEAQVDPENPKFFDESKFY